MPYVIDHTCGPCPHNINTNININVDIETSNQRICLTGKILDDTFSSMQS